MSVQHFSSYNFNAEVLSCDKLVLVDFWAPWCSPCRMMGPVLDEIAQETQTVKVGKVNIDKEPELAQAYGVLSIPTLAVFHGGKLVRQSTCARPKQAVLDLLGG